MKEKISVIYVEPNKEPVKKELENTLEALQAAVDGYIEVLGMERGVVLVCNEEGKNKGLPANRIVFTEYGGADIIVGNFFLCGESGEDFTDFPESLEREYMEMLKA